MNGFWHSAVLGGIAVLASCTDGSEAASGAASSDAAPDTTELATDGVQAVVPPIAKADTPERLDLKGLEGEFTQGGWVRGKVPSGTQSLSLDGVAVEIGGDGSFFAAFDRDAGEATKLMAVYRDGNSFSASIKVSPRKWQISRVNVPRGRGRNLEAYWKKREPEYNAIVAARAKSSDTDGWKQDFIWPVKGRISGFFGRQRIYAGEPGSYHSGIDIAPGNGVPYVAPADGVVTLARMGFSLEGGLVIIDHGNGLNSAFLHSSKIAVKEGQSVKQGQYVGNVGATGRASGPHLHWGLKWGEARLDPLLLVGPMN